MMISIINHEPRMFLYFICHFLFCFPSHQSLKLAEVRSAVSAKVEEISKDIESWAEPCLYTHVEPTTRKRGDTGKHNEDFIAGFAQHLFLKTYFNSTFFQKNTLTSFFSARRTVEVTILSLKEFYSAKLRFYFSLHARILFI